MDKHDKAIFTHLNPDEDALISTKEAAAMLGVSMQKVYNLVKRNDIPFFRRGRKILLRKMDLDLDARQSPFLPKGIIEVKREYYPDMERMKKALEVLLRS